MHIPIAKQTIITIGVALLLALGGIFSYQLFRADLGASTAADLEKEQKALAEIAAGEIEAYFYDMQKRMETIALMPTVRNAERSETCNHNLQEIVEVNKLQLSNLGRVDKDGTFICAVNRSIVGEPVSKYGDYFTTIANDPAHKPATSALIFPTGSASAVVAIHVPVFDSAGNFNGTVGGAMYFDELQKRILHGVLPTKNSVLTLYNESFDILSNPDPLLVGKNLLSDTVLTNYDPPETIKQFAERVKKGSKEGMLRYSFQGEWRTATYKTARAINRNWTVLVVVPHKDIQTAGQYQAANGIFIAAIILSVLAGTAATFALLKRLAPRKKSPAKTS